MNNEQMQLFHEKMRERANAARKQAEDIASGVITDSYFPEEHYRGKVEGIVNSMTLFWSIVNEKP